MKIKTDLEDVPGVKERIKRHFSRLFEAELIVA